MRKYRIAILVMLGIFALGAAELAFDPAFTVDPTKTTSVNCGTKYKGVFTATGYKVFSFKAYDATPAAALVKVWFNNYTGSSHSYHVANSGTYNTKGITAVKFGAYSSASAKTVYIVGQ